MLTRYIFKLLPVLFLACCCIPSSATIIEPTQCKGFLNATEVYLIESSYAVQSLTSSDGATTFSFEELVKKAWPDKKIISISEDNYKQLEEVNKKYFIVLGQFVMDGKKSSTATISDDFKGIAMTGIFIRRGQFGSGSSKAVAWMMLNVKEIFAGTLSERLLHAVENLKTMIQNYKDKSFKGLFYYKSIDYKKNYLESKTLYIQREQLDSAFQNEEKIKEVYPHRFKIVEKEEWTKAISEKNKEIIYLEIISSSGAGQSRNSVDLYNAEDGKLILSMYPWINMDGKPTLIKALHLTKLL